MTYATVNIYLFIFIIIATNVYFVHAVMDAIYV